ncbi:hypothetical protein NE237_018787 [Protea cynaroides]|uniref:Uncharacterized protein n=1 Tax=Protea cynaroides TaxID=273540 RepID=A0A9Q0KAH8_9MAGN|nr:hypothetical protein NE237_018787 [Protea cynaroides]
MNLVPLRDGCGPLPLHLQFLLQQKFLKFLFSLLLIPLVYRGPGSHRSDSPSSLPLPDYNAIDGSSEFYASPDSHSLHPPPTSAPVFMLVLPSLSGPTSVNPGGIVHNNITTGPALSPMPGPSGTCSLSPCNSTAPVCPLPEVHGHPMLTRGKAGIHKLNPKYALIVSSIPLELSSVKEALSDEGRHQWNLKWLLWL